MAETALDTAVGEPQLLAGLAYERVTGQEFDYFDSRSTAREHGRVEGVDLRRLAKTPSGDYTRLPRAYPPTLMGNLDIAFTQLVGPEPETFLHFDRYGATLGRTRPEGDQALELKMPRGGHSCSLRLESCDFIRFSLLPAEALSASIEKGSAAPLDLPLGRNVLTRDYTEEDEAQALRDRNRDWEKILVVGGSAVEEHLQVILESLEPGTDHPMPNDMQRDSFMIGALMFSPILAGQTAGAEKAES